VVENSKIAMLSTVINFELYAKSSQFFPKDIQKYVIDGRNGMHGLESIIYMMKKLKRRNIEWLIMSDEDVLFQDAAVVFEIISQMKAKNYTVCGVRDGGMISHRTYNPFIINTFFSIINFKEIEKIWNKKEIMNNNYILSNEFDDDLTKIKTKYDLNSLYEPYYCFYLWLRRKNKQFLFLNTQMNKDQITNSVLYEGKEFLHHTWYARAYGNNDNHTTRIDKIFEFLKFQESKKSNPIIFKDYTFFLIQKIKKNYYRIIKKLNRIK